MGSGSTETYCGKPGTEVTVDVNAVECRLQSLTVLSFQGDTHRINTSLPKNGANRQRFA